MRRIIFWGFIFVLFSAFVFGAELERYSGQSEDDGQEATSGAVNTSFTYVELVVKFERWGGAYRFPNATIPQDATINSAYLSLHVYAGDYIHSIDSIACENVDSATIISGGPGNEYNISNRWNNRTDAAILWQEDVRPSGRDSTPDLGSLVQEIVNRPNWKSGNAIIFLFKCAVIDNDSSAYETYSWDTDPNSVYGAILHVNYTPSSTPNDPPIVSDIRDSTITEGETFDQINLDDYVT
ncbi:MAG: hypothetical protein KAX39_07870, partial [candidate division Zixibacteria bacterium]|nr:hypothetical protein [candidate division Zixibacteria bacterium]